MNLSDIESTGNPKSSESKTDVNVINFSEERIVNYFQEHHKADRIYYEDSIEYWDLIVRSREGLNNHITLACIMDVEDEYNLEKISSKIDTHLKAFSGKEVKADVYKLTINSCTNYADKSFCIWIDIVIFCECGTEFTEYTMKNYKFTKEKNLISEGEEKKKVPLCN